MDININITEEQMQDLIEEAVRDMVKGVVNEHWNREMRVKAFGLITKRVTENVIETMPDYFKDKEEAIIDKAAERLAKGLRFTNVDVIAALLTLSNEDD